MSVAPSRGGGACSASSRGYAARIAKRIAPYRTIGLLFTTACTNLNGPANTPAAYEMATKAKRAPKPGNTRYRRSDEELIQDLQKRIEELKARKAVKKLKASPASNQANNAYRALTKGIDMCKGAEDAELKRALSEAQRTLADYFETKGIALPKARKPRARKKK